MTDPGPYYPVDRPSVHRDLGGELTPTEIPEQYVSCSLEYPNLKGRSGRRMWIKIPGHNVSPGSSREETIRQAQIDALDYFAKLVSEQEGWPLEDGLLSIKEISTQAPEKTDNIQRLPLGYKAQMPDSESTNSRRDLQVTDETTTPPTSIQDTDEAAGLFGNTDQTP